MAEFGINSYIIETALKSSAYGYTYTEIITPNSNLPNKEEDAALAIENIKGDKNNQCELDFTVHEFKFNGIAQPIEMGSINKAISITESIFISP